MTHSGYAYWLALAERTLPFDETPTSGASVRMRAAWPAAPPLPLPIALTGFAVTLWLAEPADSLEHILEPLVMATVSARLTDAPDAVADPHEPFAGRRAHPERDVSVL